MSSKIHLFSIQQALKDHHIDGWLVYDFKGKNRVALDLFGISPSSFLTRRFFYWVPAEGEPVKIFHATDATLAQNFEGKTRVYSSWKELETTLFSVLSSARVIAMEYWPSPLLPSQAILDASTKEWISLQDITIVSSWPIIGSLVGQFTDFQKESHQAASAITQKAIDTAWTVLQKKLASNTTITEKGLQEVVIGVMHEEGAIFDHPPIVAVGTHTAIPHHESQDAPITKNSLVLIDAWCKLNDSFAPYADLTQMAFTGKKVPEKISKIYDVVRQAQEAALMYIDTCLKNGCSIFGAEVDIACRSVIESHGFGKYFCHRTGHNIFLSVHGPGANLDNFETRDTRRLTVNSCYSVEPGIYIPDTYGVRVECNVLIDSPKTTIVSGKAPNTLRTLC
jgi:hypothetical protein